MTENKQFYTICRDEKVTLTALDPEESYLDFSVCFCGSINCDRLPIMVPNNEGVNQWCLFYEHMDDALKQWGKQLKNSKSSLYIPARGHHNKGRFNGRCDICKQYYNDYLDHINKPSHVMKVRSKKIEEDVQDLLNIMKKKDREKGQLQANKRQWKGGRYVNKEGKHKFSTRFTKKWNKERRKLK